MNKVDFIPVQDLEITVYTEDGEVEKVEHHECFVVSTREQLEALLGPVGEKE